jgi:hypothetical protein
VTYFNIAGIILLNRPKLILHLFNAKCAPSDGVEEKTKQEVVEIGATRIQNLHV